MVRFGTAAIALFILIALSFQNCSEETAMKGEPEPNALQVTMDDDTNSDDSDTDSDNDNTDEQDTPQPVQVTEMLFAYSADTDSFKYSINLGTGRIFEVANPDNQVFDLPADKLQEVTFFINNTSLYPDRFLDPDESCTADEIGAPVYARIPINDTDAFTLNGARFECQGRDFITGDNTNPERLTIDIDGTATTLQTLLADLAAEIDASTGGN